jgi:hypothetical protein
MTLIWSQLPQEQANTDLTKSILAFSESFSTLRKKQAKAKKNKGMGKKNRKHEKA